MLFRSVPGCGKSLSAKAISASWKLPLYRLDFATVQGSYVGQSEQQLKDALTTTKNMKGESEAVYYSNNQDITKGKTTYNNNPEVKVVGVDVKTKEIEGSVKSLDIISVQDSVNGKSRGYSVNVGIGFGKHMNGEKVVNGPYISSVGAGYSKSDTTQKITRNVSEFSVIEIGRASCRERV